MSRTHFKILICILSVLLILSLVLTLSLTKINNDLNGTWKFKGLLIDFRRGGIFDGNRVIGNYKKRPDGSWEIIPNNHPRAIEGYAVVKDDTCELFLIHANRPLILKRTSH